MLFISLRLYRQRHRAQSSGNSMAMDNTSHNQDRAFWGWAGDEDAMKGMKPQPPVGPADAGREYKAPPG